MEEILLEAVRLIKNSRFTTAFTGAGISVESGIPPFRGNSGIWNKYDPEMLDIGFFKEHPVESWSVIRDIFYAFLGTAKPNKAHEVLARMEASGFLGRTITQNIDNLHQEAGTREIYEFHGNSKKLICLSCFRKYRFTEIGLDHLPPTCRECGGLLKPDFVFFGEAIPPIPLAAAYEAASISDVFLVIGTTGEVMPASQFPYMAKNNGAHIIEINPDPSAYTSPVTDLFLQGNATEIMEKLEGMLFPPALDNNEDGVD